MEGVRINKNTIRISQSIIKGLGFRIVNGLVKDYDKHCPALFKHKIIDGNFPCSPVMLAGVVLESNLIGASRNEAVMELPLTKRGKPPIAQTRIEQHATSFKEQCERDGVVVSEFNVQMPILCEFPYKVNEQRVILTGVTDIFPVVIGDAVSCVDIKYYSGNLRADSFWASDSPMRHDSCYKDDEHFNTLQASMYRYIIKNMKIDWLKKYWKDNGIEDELFEQLITEKSLRKIQEHYVPFAWWIFSTAKFNNPTEQQLYKPHIPMNGEMVILKEVVRRSVERYLEWEEDGFQPKRSDVDCAKCPLKEGCKEYKN